MTFENVEPKSKEWEVCSLFAPPLRFKKMCAFILATIKIVNFFFIV